MLDFQKITRNIASESKKVGYNPETDTNWCHLPMEMRKECMKWMGFKSRCLLRRTSKLEKLLIDLKKYNFANVKIVPASNNGWQITEQRKSEDGSRHPECCLNYKGSVMQIQCISEMFKKGVIENFEYRSGYAEGTVGAVFLDLLAKFAPFPFKRITVDFKYGAKFFLENCANLERITITGSYYEPYRVQELFALPSVIYAKEIRIHRIEEDHYYSFLRSLAKKWDNNDAEVGKSFQSVLEDEDEDERTNFVNMMDFIFYVAVIEKTENEVRVRMKDPKKQILIRCIGCHESYKYTSCKVIPIDLPKSEYGIGDEWIEWEFKSQLDKQIGDENPYNDI